MARNLGRCRTRIAGTNSSPGTPEHVDMPPGRPIELLAAEEDCAP
jgi:hypothetical protein